MTNTPPPRNPLDILADFDAAVKGTADIDPYDILWEIIGDVSGSYELAMIHEGINPDTIGNVSNTVGDYLSSYYGD
jgi:hypothetical protein